MLRVSVSTEYSYCLLGCSGIGNHSQGANINISLNLMNLLRNVIALTFNTYQIIENYMTPISHFDVHGTWAVCIWLTSCLVTGLPLCKAILYSEPSLLIAAYLSLFHEYVSVPLLFPFTKLLQPRLSLLLCLFPSSVDNSATCAGQQSSIAMTSSSHLEMVVPDFCICSPFALHGGGLSGSSSLLPMVGYQHHKAACTLHSQVPPGECSTDLFLVILLAVSSFLLAASRKIYILA